MLAVSMPNADTASPLVESAAKCLAMEAGSVSLESSHSFADLAFVIVSCVVNVFDAMRNKVVSASRSRRVSAMCVPSTLETKCTLSSTPSARVYGLSASVTMTGPRSLPPMPRLTTSVIFLPVKPFHSPERTEFTKTSRRLRTSLTSGMTSAPSTMMGVFARLRSATCSTARFSVMLIFSPANIFFASPSTSASLHMASRSAMVSSVTMFLE
mmetsp:Transcript_17542/g.45005  ORF Transcript_17542/g.45005 Transcript_17542/m.45005 type:complete len:212 (+) Transcript_17542:1398-2033(+)